MKTLAILVLACLTVTPVAFAQSSDAPSQSDPSPTEGSVRQLLEITQAKRILKAASDQLDIVFDGMVKKQLDGENVTSEQQQAIQTRRRAAEAMVKDLLSWESMEPLYVKVYGETFSQSEVDGMIAFYSTPTGRAVVAKMPLATKNTMSEMQQRMQQMIPKLQKMAKETAEQVKAQGGTKKSG